MKDYRTLVVEVYNRKKADPNWRPNLSRPTPNSIKKECEIVCRERWVESDKECLRIFFGTSKDVKSVLDAIRIHPTDNFKTVIRFLEGKTRKPADKVVELAAWLVDVRPRPYQSNVDYGQILSEFRAAGRLPEGTQIIEDDTSEPSLSWLERILSVASSKPIFKYAMSLAVLVALTAIG